MILFMGEMYFAVTAPDARLSLIWLPQTVPIFIIHRSSDDVQGAGKMAGCSSEVQIQILDVWGTFAKVIKESAYLMSDEG